MKTRLLAAALVVGASTLAAPVAATAALTVGDRLYFEVDSPTVGSIANNGGTFIYTGPGQVRSAWITSVTIFDDRIVFSQVNGCGGVCYNNGAQWDWNGPVLIDASNGSAFSGWAVRSDTVGIRGSYNSGGAVGVNWGGAAVTNEGRVVVGVPEPQSGVLLLAGLAGLGAVARRNASNGRPWRLRAARPAPRPRPAAAR